MKPISIILCLLSVLVIACAGAPPATAGIPGLSISPATVQNDYTGKIVLSISGLDPGKTVVIEKFADANGNGIVDAGESLVQSFRVTDGQLSSIGGVRNINVPGDEDGLVDGQIRAEVPYPGLDATLDQIAGNYLFRVTDPDASFSPPIQSFIVSQTIYPQGVTGKIISSQTGLPLAYAFVVLLTQSGNGGNGTYTNATGDFTLYCVPGSYQLLAIKPGFVSNMSSSTVTVTANQFLTSNAALTTANRTITGKVSETPGGVGIPGTMLQAETEPGEFALTFTDSAGNFTLSVTAGQWKINLDDNLAQQGYVPPDWDSGPVADTTISSVTLPDIQVAKATALVFGKVNDNLGTAVLGIGVYAQDDSRSHEAYGKSLSPDGSYAIGVLAGNWWVGPSDDDLSARGYIGQGVNVSLTAGQALQVDISLRRITAHLRGHVVDGSGSPVADVGIVAGIDQGGTWSSSYARTDSNGYFDLWVDAGLWTLRLEMNDAASRGLIGPEVSLTVIDGVDQNDITYSVRSIMAQISVHVRGKDGVGLANIGLYAYATMNGKHYNVNGRTDGSGSYQLQVSNGVWQVGVNGDDLRAQGYDPVAEQTVTISGANGSADFAAQLSSLGPLQVQTSSLPDSNKGLWYQVQLSASGGRQPYNWSLTPGSNLLPPGLQFYSDGSIQGAPQATGTFNFIVRVTDSNLATADKGLSITVLNAGPPPPVITDDGAYTTSTSQLHAQWSPGGTGGTVECRYAIGTSPTDPGSGYLLNWTSTGAGTNVTADSLPLSVGRTYYFYVKTKDGTGLWSPVGVSNGIVVVSQICASPGLAKLAANGTVIGLSAVVTATSTQTGNYMYVQSTDRSSGIRVNADIVPSVVPGDLVAVAGTMSTADGERVIVDARVEKTGSTNQPRPLAMPNRSLGGGDWHYSQSTGTGQMGVTGGSGLNNIGLLVRTWGQVKEFDPAPSPTWFVIDDGSGVDVRCEVPSGVAVHKTWTLVAVTGISRLNKVGDDYRRRISLRNADDITVVK